MSLLDTLDPILKPWAQQLYDLAKSAGVKPQVTSARRTYAQQAALYKSFQEGRSRLPAAAPGTSAHEWGLAFDMVVDNSTDQTDLGTVWVSWGGVYGGVHDPVHFEYPGFSPTAGTAPTAPVAPTISDTRRKAELLADQLLYLVPLPLRGILNTAAIASQILTIFGSQAAAGVDWLLTHPSEAIDMMYDIVESAWRELWSQI